MTLDFDVIVIVIGGGPGRTGRDRRTRAVSLI
jgi:hypothetical protein